MGDFLVLHPLNDGHTSWYIGVFLALCSSLIGALGDNIVRLSYIKEMNKPNKVLRPLYLRPLWILGEFLTLVCNPIITVLSLKFAATSIVVPFGGLHIFWNLVLCGYLLNEKLSKAEVIGSLVILLGVITVVVFGTHEMPGYNIDKVVKLFEQTNFIFYSVFCVFFASCLLYYSRINWKQLFVDAFFTRDRSDFTHDQSHIVEYISVCALSGICGGNGNLLAKACIEAVNEGGIEVISRHEFVIIFTSTAMICTLQAICLTIAFARYQAKFVVPIANALLVASGSVGGIILFKEYSEKDPFAMFFFSIGICSVISGILILLIDTSSLKLVEISKDEERFSLIQNDMIDSNTNPIVETQPQLTTSHFISNKYK